MRKHNLLRVAAATTVTVFMTMAGLGPVHAANDQPNEQDRGNSANAPEKHDPVTVCHALGNGGYLELTFDDDAYEAHLEHHGDISPVPEGGCPSGSDESGGDETEGDETGGGGADDGGKDTGEGKGTTRVEVCHVEGNGSYHVIEFDDAALDAHVEHGDLYPVPEDGCPVPGDETGGDETGGDETGGDETGGDETGGHQTGGNQTGGNQTGGDETDGDEVLGIEAEVSAGGDAEVAGAGAATANRAPAAVAPAAATTAPAAGILPATGAGDYTVALLAGGVLLAAGGVLIARRRLHREY